MQINDICEKQWGDKPEYFTRPKCQQIGHQTTTKQQGREEVDDVIRGADKEKNNCLGHWDSLTATAEPSNGYEEILIILL